MIESTRADTSPICWMVASQHAAGRRARPSLFAACLMGSKPRRSSSAASVSAWKRSKAPVAAVAPGGDVAAVASGGDVRVCWPRPPSEDPGNLGSVVPA